MSGIVAFLGRLPVERQSIERLAWKYGWSFRHAGSLSELTSLSERKVVSVLFDPKDLDTDWRTALQWVGQAAPDALPIICSRFSEAIRWPEMAGAGAYHILHYPFALNEIRQCFGFVREAQRRHHELGLSRWPPPTPFRPDLSEAIAPMVEDNQRVKRIGYGGARKT
jgi:DNA-binding NtrC family response regulator